MAPYRHRHAMTETERRFFEKLEAVTPHSGMRREVMGEQDIILSKLPAAHASHRGAVTIVVGALYSRLIRLLGTQQRGRARKIERRRLFATSPDLILLVNRRGQFVEVSPSSAAILRYQPEEMIGRNGTEFLHPQDLEKTRKEMRAARAGHLMHNFECRHLHKDGRVVALEWTGIWSEPERQYFLIGRDMREISLRAAARRSSSLSRSLISSRRVRPRATLSGPRNTRSTPRAAAPTAG